MIASIGLAGADVVVSLSSSIRFAKNIEWLVVSYSITGLGNLKIEEIGGLGVLLDIDINTTQPVILPFLFNAAFGKELRVTLKGIVGAIGKVTVANFNTEP